MLMLCNDGAFVEHAYKYFIQSYLYIYEYVLYVNCTVHEMRSKIRAHFIFIWHLFCIPESELKIL